MDNGLYIECDSSEDVNTIRAVLIRGKSWKVKKSSVFFTSSGEEEYGKLLLDIVAEAVAIIGSQSITVHYDYKTLSSPIKNVIKFNTARNDIFSKMLPDKKIIIGKETLAIRDHVTASPDGSYNSETGVGGWAFVLSAKCNNEVFNGSMECKDSHDAELIAAIKALEQVPVSVYVTLRVDYKKLVDAFEQGKDFNIKRSKELWDRYFELINREYIDVIKVRAHSSDQYNSAADRLAKRARIDNEFDTGKRKNKKVRHRK